MSNTETLTGRTDAINGALEELQLPDTQPAQAVMGRVFDAGVAHGRAEAETQLGDLRAELMDAENRLQQVQDSFAEFRKNATEEIEGLKGQVAM